MKQPFITAMLLAGVCGLHGAGVKAGKARLRDLVVVPAMNLTGGYTVYASRADLLEDHLVPGEIERLRKEAKAKPEDVQSLLRLGMLLNRRGETNEAASWYGLAERAARKKSELRPQDGITRTCLADALNALDKVEEAESIYRNATVISSNEWRCWVGLGRFLGVRSVYVLLPGDKADQVLTSVDALTSVAADFRPRSEALAKSEAMRKESERCFDRAISLAPKEVDVYLGRAAIQLDFGIVDTLISFYRNGQPLDAKQTRLVYYSCGAIQYLREAAHLCSDDDRIIVLAAACEGGCEMLNASQANPGAETSLKGLPDKVQTSLREAMSRLETLSHAPDTERASGASERLGFLRIMTGDNRGAKVALRHAATLEPAREKAWEMLLAAAVDSDTSSEELASICESLLERKNSARNHLLLAKVLIRQNKFDEAMVETGKAAELEPDNLLAHLIAGAIALKTGGDDDRLSLASKEMTRADELFRKMESSNEYSTRWREFALNGAILCGLLDKDADARDWLNEVLKHFPNDERAKEILSALEK